MRQDWWKRLFEGIGTQIAVNWDDGHRNDWEARKIWKLLNLREGDRVLDIPCGYGRLGHALALRGAEVVGVDYQEQLIKEAQERNYKWGTRPRWIVEDMRRFKTRIQFDAAICTYGSFGYFEDEENEAFINNLTRALVPDGSFLLETPTAESLLPRLMPKSFYWTKFGPVEEVCHFDSFTSRVNSKWTLWAGRLPISSSSSIRLYTTMEIASLFRSCGFRSLRIHPSLSAGFDGFTTPQVVFVGERLSKT